LTSRLATPFRWTAPSAFRTTATTCRRTTQAHWCSRSQ